jgi:hypothetical protein
MVRIVSLVSGVGELPSCCSLSRTPRNPSCAVSFAGVEGYFLLQDDLIQDALDPLAARERLARRRAKDLHELDDGKRSATVSTDVCRTPVSKASRYSSWYLHRLPTDSLTKVSLMSWEIILVRLTGAAPAPADAAMLRTNRATSSSRMRRNDCTRTADDAEELQHGDLAELAPPVAVGSEDDVGAVEGERGYGGVQVPVGERDVVGLGDRLRGLRRRHHQRGHLAQAEHHERPVLVREAAHRAVDGWASDEVVEAADQRQCPWTRRQV